MPVSTVREFLKFSDHRRLKPVSRILAFYHKEHIDCGTPIPHPQGFFSADGGKQVRIADDKRGMLVSMHVFFN